MFRARVRRWSGKPGWILALAAVLMAFVPEIAGCRHNASQGGNTQIRCPEGTKETFHKQIEQLGRCTAPASKRGLFRFENRLVEADLPLLTDANRARIGYTIAVTSKGLRVPDSAMDQGPDKQEAILEQLKKDHGLRASDDEQGVKDFAFLFVTRDAPARLVALALDLLWKAGFRRVSFLVRPRKGPECHPPLPAYFRKLRREGAPEEQAVMATKALDKLLKGCSAAASVLDRAARVAPEKRAKFLSKGFADAFQGCGCTVDWKKIVTALYALFMPHKESLVGEYETPLDAKAPGIPVQGNALWKDVAPKVFALEKRPLWLRVQGPSTVAR